MRIIALRQFVTPQTIWLTILTRLYCDGVVAEQDTIRILSFLTARLLPGLPNSSTTAAESHALDNDVSLSGIEAALQHLQAAPECPEVKQIGPTSVWQVFVIRHCAIVHLDALEDYVTKIEHLFKTVDEDSGRRQCVLAKHSLLGAFVQRVALSFSQESFNSHMSLWYEFAEHRIALIRQHEHLFGRPSMISYKHNVQKERLLEARSNSEQSLYGLIARHEHATRPGLNSNEQLDGMLRFQVAQMQRLGARLGQELEKRLITMIDESREDSTLSHYFNFLSAWYAGDYSSALDNLHRYYDYTMPDNTLLKSRYPYACLNMAVLQADFDCFEEALPAIKEAITTAREAKDHDCLAFCLSWLYHFSLVDRSEDTQRFASDMLGGSGAGLSYLLQQAHEQKLYDLEISMLIGQAKAALASGKRPLQALELLHESSTLGLLNGITNLNGASLLVISSLFSELGLSDIARAYADLALFWYQEDVTVAERLQAGCRAAINYTNAGDFEKAEKALADAKQAAANNLKHMQLVSQYAGIVKLMRAVYCSDQSKSELLLETLAKAPCPDPSLVWERSLLETELCIRVHDYTNAFSLVDDLFSKLDRSPINPSTPLHLRIRLMNLKCRIFIEADRTPKALSIALRAALAAYRARAFVLLWESMALLAYVMQSVRNHDVAIELGLMYVEQARESGNLRVLALLQCALAGSYQGLYGASLDTGAESAQVPGKEADSWFGETRDSLDILHDEASLEQMLTRILRCDERHSKTLRQQGTTEATMATAAELTLRHGGHAEWDLSKLDAVTL